MQPAPLHPQETTRLNSLRSFEILDTQGEQAYDELTRLASQIAGTEIALVSLVDEDRQWFKSKHGLQAAETPRDIAFCAHAILTPEETFIVEDASVDQRFQNNPLVTGDPAIRFYLGIPLRSPVDEMPLGTLCTISPRVMSLPAEKIEQLRIVAHQVERLLALRRANIALRLYSKELADANIIAENANQAKSRFLATISHDMRTPLNGLVGTLEMLDEELETESQHEMAHTAASCAKVLLQLVNDTLDLSVIESGTIQLANEPFDPAKVIQETARVVGATLSEKPIRLETSVDPEMPDMLMGDELRCQQVVLNLLSNAAKFTKHGSITVKSSFREGTWIISVSDTGPGIPAEDLEKIFEPFVQSSAGRQASSGGAGLGLNISRRICLMLGGDIEVSSTIGEGSTFTASMTLPVSEKRVEEKVLSSVELPQLSVLIAEDDRISREILSAQLSRLGCCVLSTKDGDEAIKELRKGAFDLALIDYNMPGMTGPEVAAAYRKDEPATEHLPIFALTARGFEDDRKACLDAGMDQMLTKPLNQLQLQQFLQSVAAGMSREAALQPA